VCQAIFPPTYPHPYPHPRPEYRLGISINFSAFITVPFG
jgi:hypothetical protein